MTVVTVRTLVPLLLVQSFLLGACGGTVRARSRGLPRNVPRVEMDPIRVQAIRDQRTGAVRLDAYDAESLFTAANHALSGGRCGTAVPLYDRIAAEFPDSRFVSASLYNAGLCLEELHRDADAIRRFEELRQRLPSSPDIKDSTYRLAGCLERLGRWPEVIATFERALERTDLSGDERMEAMVRRAAGVFELGDLDRTDSLLRDALVYYRTGSGAEQLQTDYFVAEAQYLLGEILRVRMEAIRFSPNEAAMRQELEQKCQYLLDAQAAYILAIRVTNPHWAAAAGYRIGLLFSTLYDHILHAPVPPALDAEQREIYFDELRRQVRPLVDKAVRVWGRTMEMGVRTGLGSANDWIVRTEHELQRLRQLVGATPAPSPPQAPGAPPAQQESGPRSGAPAPPVPNIS